MTVDGAGLEDVKVDGAGFDDCDVFFLFLSKSVTKGENL